MVLAERPVIELVKFPIPMLSEVRLSAMVGDCAVLQQTPRAVMVSPPSEVIVPPLLAVVCVMSVTVSVVRAIGTGGVTGSLQQSFLQVVRNTNNNPNPITVRIMDENFSSVFIIKILRTTTDQYG